MISALLKPVWPAPFRVTLTPFLVFVYFLQLLWVATFTHQWLALQYDMIQRLKGGAKEDWVATEWTTMGWSWPIITELPTEVQNLVWPSRPGTVQQAASDVPSTRAGFPRWLLCKVPHPGGKQQLEPSRPHNLLLSWATSESADQDCMCLDANLDLDELIELVIMLDQHLRSKSWHNTPLPQRSGCVHSSWPVTSEGSPHQHSCRRSGGTNAVKWLSLIPRGERTSGKQDTL